MQQSLNETWIDSISYSMSSHPRHQQALLQAAGATGLSAQKSKSKRRSKVRRDKEETAPEGNDSVEDPKKLKSGKKKKAKA